MTATRRRRSGRDRAAHRRDVRRSPGDAVPRFTNGSHRRRRHRSGRRPDVTTSDSNAASTAPRTAKRQPRRTPGSGPRSPANGRPHRQSRADRHEAPHGLTLTAACPTAQLAAILGNIGQHRYRPHYAAAVQDRNSPPSSRVTARERLRMSRRLDSGGTSASAENSGDVRVRSFTSHPAPSGRRQAPQDPICNGSRVLGNVMRSWVEPAPVGPAGSDQARLAE